MAKSVLLKADIDAAGVFVHTLINLGFPVRVAAWLRTDTDRRWQLYIATPNVEVHGPISVYRFFLSVLEKVPSALLAFDINDVVAANTTNHFVNRFTKSGGVIFEDTLGGTLFDDMVLYVVNKNVKPWSRKGKKASASEVTNALKMAAASRRCTYRNTAAASNEERRG